MTLIYKTDWTVPPPIARTKREMLLEVYLVMALPYLQREEGSTHTSPVLRSLIADIEAAIK